MNPLTMTLIGSSFLLLVAAGCSRAAGTPNGEVTLAVEVGDQFVFSPDRFHCLTGQPVRLRLTSRLRTDGSALMHNVAALAAGVDPDTFGQAAVTARPEDGYVPAGFAGRVIAASGFARGGETVEFVFVAPKTAGVYPVVCTFPGHCLLGMKATLVVE